MKLIVFQITIEVPDDTPSSEMDRLQVAFEDIVYKNNYELYEAEWDEQV